MTQTLKDSSFRVIGYLEDDGSKVTLKDNCFKVLGYYDKKTDTCKDFYGRVIGYGFMLCALLDKP